MSARCPVCRTKVYVESLDCPTCSAPIAFHPPTREFVALPGDPFVGRQLGGRFSLLALLGSPGGDVPGSARRIRPQLGQGLARVALA